MEITCLGHASFKIRGKSATVVTDPFSPQMVGFSFPKVEADIVTISHEHEDHNQAKRVGGDPFVIASPGEYEVKGVSVFGLATFHDASAGSARGKNTIYLIEMDGLRLCHLGDLGHKLATQEVEELNGIDILFIPVGGVFTIGPQEAREVIGSLEPKITIPMHYQTSGLTSAVFGKLAGVEEFLKEMGEEAVTSLPKLLITGEKLPEERQIVVLERRG